MFKRQLVHQSPRRAPKNRRVATRLQPTTPAQLVGLLAARRVCTHTSGDPDMRRASTWRLEKETLECTLRLRHGVKGGCCRSLKNHCTAVENRFQSVKRRRALPEGNLPRNSRLET